MNWRAYVNSHLIKKGFKQGAIASKDGNIYATSDMFAVTTEEVKFLSEIFYSDALQSLETTGFKLGGYNYSYYSIDDNSNVLRGNRGKGDVHVLRTEETILIGVYEEPMLAQQASAFIECLAEYLKIKQQRLDTINDFIRQLREDEWEHVINELDELFVEKALRAKARKKVKNDTKKSSVFKADFSDNEFESQSRPDEEQEFDRKTSVSNDIVHLNLTEALQHPPLLNEEASVKTNPSVAAKQSDEIDREPYDTWLNKVTTKMITSMKSVRTSISLDNGLQFCVECSYSSSLGQNVKSTEKCLDPSCRASQKAASLADAEKIFKSVTFEAKMYGIKLPEMKNEVNFDSAKEACVELSKLMDILCQNKKVGQTKSLEKTSTVPTFVTSTNMSATCNESDRNTASSFIERLPEGVRLAQEQDLRQDGTGTIRATPRHEALRGPRAEGHRLHVATEPREARETSMEGGSPHEQEPPEERGTLRQTGGRIPGHIQRGSHELQIPVRHAIHSHDGPRRAAGTSQQLGTAGAPQSGQTQGTPGGIQHEGGVCRDRRVTMTGQSTPSNQQASPHQHHAPPSGPFLDYSTARSQYSGPRSQHSANPSLNSGADPKISSHLSNQSGMTTSPRIATPSSYNAVSSHQSGVPPHHSAPPQNSNAPSSQETIFVRAPDVSDSIEKEGGMEENIGEQPGLSGEDNLPKDGNSIENNSDTEDKPNHKNRFVNSFPCEICGEAFKNKTVLRNHKKIHKTESSFSCSGCFQKFDKKTALNIHMQSCDSVSRKDEIQKFKCDTCHKLYSTASYLIKHKRTHTGEQPYSCPYNCGKAFGFSTARNRHKIVCNFKDMGELKEEGQGKNSKEIADVQVTGEQSQFRQQVPSLPQQVRQGGIQSTTELSNTHAQAYNTQPFANVQQYAYAPQYTNALHYGNGQQYSHSEWPTQSMSQNFYYGNVPQYTNTQYYANGQQYFNYSGNANSGEYY